MGDCCFPHPVWQERDLQEFARCFDGFKEMRLIDTPFKRFALMQFNNDSYAEQVMGAGRAR